MRAERADGMASSAPALYLRVLGLRLPGPAGAGVGAAAAFAGGLPVGAPLTLPDAARACARFAAIAAMFIMPPMPAMGLPPGAPAPPPAAAFAATSGFGSGSLRSLVFFSFAPPRIAAKRASCMLPPAGFAGAPPEPEDSPSSPSAAGAAGAAFLSLTPPLIAESMSARLLREGAIIEGAPAAGEKQEESERER